MLKKVLFAAAALQAQALAQNCPSLTAAYPAPSLASGYEAKLVAQNLNKPRGLIFDNANNLLVVEREVGVTAFKVETSGTCVTLSDKRTVVGDATLNHGIELSPDSRTLYASNPSSVYAYTYSPSTRATTGSPKTLIKGMHTTGQVTRSLLLSRHSPSKLLVSRGSDENIDLSTVDIGTGQSQIRIFDASKTDVEYTAGTTLAWGLRNAVGLAEHPVDGGVWSAENNADNLERDGFRIHENNPAEELNYHGVLSSPSQNALLGANYGFPLCYGVWDANEIPGAGELSVGQQFAIAEANASRQDGFCAEARVAPRLVWQPHSSPIDVKFDARGENMYVSLRGSWNRASPVGYSVSLVAFSPSTFQPLAPPSSTSSLTPIFSNSNTTACPENCFRPAGLAWDRDGRLYVSSDATGEIYVITKSGGLPVDGARKGVGNSAPGAVGVSVAGVVLAALGTVVVGFL